MNQSSPYSTLILIALMVLAFYFLILRPNKRRQQAQQQVRDSLTPGTQVLLTSGIFGTVVELGDRQAVLELASGVQVTVLKQAIARAVQPSDVDTAELDDDTDTDAVAGTPVAGTPVADTRSVTTEGTVNQTQSGTAGSHAVADGAEPEPYAGSGSTPTRD